MAYDHALHKQLHDTFCDTIDGIFKANRSAGYAKGREAEIIWAETLHRAVNVLDLVIRAERTACGHIDYVTKFAFYCVELVMDTSPLQKDS
jgi:hypothetical protein